MTAANPDRPPDALLLIAPGCPHCAAVLEGLGGLVKEATIGRLEVVNIAAQPERAEALGVRSVPWTRIGPFELEGLHSPGELRRWAEQTTRAGGMAAYLDELLKGGHRQKAEDLVRRQPEHQGPLLDLLGDPETGIKTRIGVMAILEELEGTNLAVGLVGRLAELTRHPNPRIRADACHALSLTGAPEAMPHLRACLQDPDADVRETAQDALEAAEEDRG